MLRPAADGSLVGGREAAKSVTVPLNSARLQARVSPEGVSELFVWGSGAAGKVVFEPPLHNVTAITINPNRVAYELPSGTVRITALPTLPAISFELEGVVTSLRLAPPRAVQPGLPGRFALASLPDGWSATSPWASAVLRSPGCQVEARGRLLLRMNAGADRDVEKAVVALGLGASWDEAAAAADSVLADPIAALRTAEDYTSELGNMLETDDLLLKGMFTACLHAAYSSRKELPGGRFAGFAAGIGYAMPPRTYFRDSYWTLQALLPFRPDLAVEQLRLLSRAVSPDGETPSGVIVASEAGELAWEAQIAADATLATDHAKPGQWWPDHFDSPNYFVLLARDALFWSLGVDERTLASGGRDASALAEAVEEPVGAISLAEKIVAVLERGKRLAAGGVLPLKPPNDRDWADNVFRHGHVTYNVSLYHGALMAGAALLALTRPKLAAKYTATAAAVRTAATERLFDVASGHFVEFLGAPGGDGDGGGERHMTLDSLVALRTGLASDAQAASSLAAAKRVLETRNNRKQPYGDWGVMANYPPYQPTTRRRGKSLFAYRYHNGSDWPYLDGIYAEALLARGDLGWRYPLTRWFEYGLERGWPTPVEYYAPPWGRGSPLNGWSAMPAAAMLLAGFGLRPRGQPRVPPWGDCTLNGARVNGARASIRVSDGALEVDVT